MASLGFACWSWWLFSSSYWLCLWMMICWNLLSLSSTFYWFNLLIRVTFCLLSKFLSRMAFPSCWTIVEPEPERGEWIINWLDSFQFAMFWISLWLIWLTLICWASKMLKSWSITISVGFDRGSYSILWRFATYRAFAIAGLIESSFFLPGFGPSRRGDCSDLLVS